MFTPARLAGVQEMIEPCRSDPYVWARVQRAVGGLVMRDALLGNLAGSLFLLVWGAGFGGGGAYVMWEEVDGDLSKTLTDDLAWLWLFPLFGALALGSALLGLVRMVFCFGGGFLMWMRGRSETARIVVGTSDAETRVVEQVAEVRASMKRSRRAGGRTRADTAARPSRTGSTSAAPAAQEASTDSGGSLTVMPTAPPGWYVPEGESGWRYWDGATWTEHTHPAPAQGPAATLP